MPALTPVTFGVLAHVDAGKTTLSEQILYHAGVLRAPGRVDHGDTALDASTVERSRGITVFSDQAWFEKSERRFTLIDTPGHVDFSAEAERALLALDMAVLMIDGGSGVRGHTAALFRLACQYHVPTVLFVNKTDLPGYDEQRVQKQISTLLSDKLVHVTNGAPDAEQLAVLDDGFCDAYLNSSHGDGMHARDEAWDTLGKLFASGDAFPVLAGAALCGAGVDELIDALTRLAAFLPVRDSAAPLEAVIYKVRHDPGGERVAYLKLLRGELRARDGFVFGDAIEKVHQLRLYRGAGYTTVDCATAGDAVGVTGLSAPRCGERIAGGALANEGAHFRFTPVLSVRVIPPENAAPALLLEKLRILEDEEPMLCVGWDAAHSSVVIRVMGEVQTEILSQVLLERFGMAVSFLPPLVLYKETILASAVGCGHYEPLRHYAEAHLRLSPAARGSGVTFESRCHVDALPLSYQSQIKAHVLERTHRGVLTGSPLTDVKIELLSGRAHLKHTEGGDFREATYRAVRQGLCKAQCVLLEPFYRFQLTLPAECLGRAMTDIASLFGVYDAPETLGETVLVKGRAPVRTFMDYPAQVRAYTHGKGDVQLEPDGYDLCHNPDDVIAELGYDLGADVDNPAGSVFCAHGAGFYVAWEHADEWMHLTVEG